MEAPADPFACPHRGEPVGKKSDCRTCGGRTKLKVFACSLYGECTIGPTDAGVRNCIECLYKGKEVSDERS